MLESVNYSLSARDVMHSSDIGARFRWMKDAGVSRVWLTGYYFGRHESELEDLRRAKLRVEGEGFDTGIISLPVGHPGNSLNPDDPDLDLRISPRWTYRVDHTGANAYFSSCINDVMIHDNAEAARIYAQLGFTKHFFDDDLRLSNLGDPVHGCFCDSCVSEFSRLTGNIFTREELIAALASSTSIASEWEAYNCSKVTRFMRETRVPGMTSGIMIMFTGGRCHGISIPDIKAAVPDCLFRVGEWHFDDRHYAAPGAKEALADGVREHLRLIGDNPAYSESTIFPAAALSPENFADKIRLEISLGLRNIYLMSGSWFISEPYWKMLADRRNEFNELASM